MAKDIGYKSDSGFAFFQGGNTSYGETIINVTSGLGEMVMPLFGAYSITKAGLIHLTKIMAEELKEYNIRVNGLDPGVMDTRMQEYLRGLGPEILGEKAYRDFLAMKQMGRLKPPEKAARLALFLASEESDSINGEIGTETFYKKLATGDENCRATP